MKSFKNGLQAREHFEVLYYTPTLCQIQRFDALIKQFCSDFAKKDCHICSASGRVEVIGNHTDHNGGKVIGSTISKDILAAFSVRTDSKVVIRSEGFRDIAFSMKDIESREANSRGMAKGVLMGMKLRGFKISGFNAYLDSNVPSGAGMSSSAAFQLLVAQISNHLFNNASISPVDLAKICQYAENHYFNKPCGLLDQGVISIGGMVKIDFKRDFDYEILQNNLADLHFVVIDTGGSHANLKQHYASIISEMKQVANFFEKQRLIEVPENSFFENINQLEKQFGSRAVLRAKHFFEENNLVEQTANCLNSGDKKGFLDSLNKSGQSSIFQLQNCSYEGSDGALLKALTEAKNLNPEGAVRVHGGGFEGTILCVVPAKDLKTFLEKMKKIHGESRIFELKPRSCGATVL